MKILSAEFVLSAKEPVHYPPASLPEVAFAGRSNVGKSSLINTLLNRRGLARTSNTPGRTQEINFFRVNDRFTFVDLPGYGYAKVPESVRRQWGPMVEIYLRERRTLKLVVLILDIRREPSLEDRQLVQWLSFFRIPFRVVLTKRDKVSSNEFVRQRAAIAAGIGIDGAAFVPFSAKSGTGKEHLWREIRSALETGN